MQLSNERGVTLIELLVVIFILSIIVGGFSEMLSVGLKASRENRDKTGFIEDANYAMNRIINAARETDWVFIPTGASPVSNTLSISAMVDNDNDGLTNEDQPGDMNGDGCPGICFRDDNGDGIVDNSTANDDDEDGMVDEDPIDPLIYYVNNGSLYEKKIIWNPTTSSNDITDKKLIDNVTQLSVERLTGLNGKVLLKIRLEVSKGRGSSVILESEVYPRMVPAGMP